jgi:HD-like signal output (HDOD) protein
MAEEYEEVGRLVEKEGMPLHQAELSILGATHAEIGALLAEKWNLPSDLGNAIARHHTPDGSEGTQLVDCVFAADQISKKLAFGSAGDYSVEPLPPSVRERFSMDIDGLISEMPTLDEEVERARVFIKLGETR